MKQRIDLDLAANVASSKFAAIAVPGLKIDALTWRDADMTGPRELTTDRHSVSIPDSLGIRALRNSAEGSLVLFDGGWTDLTFINANDDVEIVETVGWDDPLDLERYGLLIERFFGLFE